MCVIDAVSLRSLEIERTIRGGGFDGSLLGVFISGGVCRTAMGKRLLREWLCRPLRDRVQIESRQRCVSAFVQGRALAERAAGAMEKIQDIARIAGRVAMGRCTPRDLVGLATSLKAAGELAGTLAGAEAFATMHANLTAACERTAALADAITRGCVENPPPHLREGGVFRDGFDAELDECRGLQRDAGVWLAEYQQRLIATHNLPSLKVGYNSVFGYYIELPTAQSRQAPPELVRKQTLKNAERYTTPELREYEGKVMNAQARAMERERVLFADLCEQAASNISHIASVADTVAVIDALSGMAEKSFRRGWRTPRMVDEPALSIEGGRHPVLDESLGSGFVPNDVELGGAAAGLALITGPNMAGKSTFIRQTALIALLAHAGSDVPADRATVGIIDRIFTRIGADDALHAGQSTFMVEMIETANILNHASANSLVVLDEVGRGTSTLDGLSLAWAIVEHLARADSPDRGPRTLFATHYHELTDLEDRFTERVKNLHVAVREWPAGDGHAEIVFLHRILPGRTDQSYGLHVARLAGMPAGVVSRAREVLAGLAVHHAGAGVAGNIAPPTPVEPKGQLSLFTEYVQHPAVDAVREMRIETLSPMQAFDSLRRLKEMVEATNGAR